MTNGEHPVAIRPRRSAADARAVDLIRVLAMDAVQEAGSGHRGTAMSLAPAAYLPGTDVILIGTGSEVQIAVAARAMLRAEGISARAVSMPCVEWFPEEDTSYQEEVLPAATRARVSVEAGTTDGWHALTGDAGEQVGLGHYGASAAYQKIFEEFGITAERVAAAARRSLDKEGTRS